MSSILVPYENSNLEIDSCYNITIPKGTDAERTHASFSLKEGALRYNTTSNVLEFYNSSSWVAPATNLTGLSDVGTATATCGNVLIGGGASFTSQAVSGDITLAANGSTVVQTSVICSQTCATIYCNNDYLLIVDATDNAYNCFFCAIIVFFLRNYLVGHVPTERIPDSGFHVISMFECGRQNASL